MTYRLTVTRSKLTSLELFTIGIASVLLLNARLAHALTGADTCAAATLSNDSLSSPLVVNDTTVGQTDDVDIDSANTACTEAPQCTGQTIGHTPVLGGMTFQGTGTAPDRVFRFRVDSACTLSVSMLANNADLNVMFSRGGCGNTAADCSCVDDSHGGGTAEQLTGISVEPLEDYYIIVDGYTLASNPPSTDAFTLTITRTSGTCNFTAEVCGNGSTGGGEACDDGNTDDCDGCHGDCSAVETGCGDGFECGAEACDDGNLVNCDGCRGDCTAEETGCGDGFICGAEACDDSNTDNCDGCRSNCLAEETGCGDGFVCGAEACDDGDTTNGDGCSSVCTTEVLSLDAGNDGGLTPLDAGGMSNTPDAAVSGGGSNDEPDAAAGGDAGVGGSGGYGGNAGDRAIGGFGNLNPGAGGNSSANPAAKKADSGCGCVTVGSEPTPSARWLTLFGLLTMLALRRRVTSTSSAH
jgi:MYXO-CTERM domain-containing protein